MADNKINLERFLLDLPDMQLLGPLTANQVFAIEEKLAPAVRAQSRAVFIERIDEGSVLEWWGCEGDFSQVRHIAELEREITALKRDRAKLRLALAAAHDHLGHVVRELIPTEEK